MAKQNYQSRLSQKVDGFGLDSGEPPTKESSVQKNKGGRPSHGDVKKITLAIPAELIKDIEVAAVAFKGNRTAYINHLIQNDLQANMDRYRELAALLK